jgi:hypothetical protein
MPSLAGLLIAGTSFTLAVSADSLTQTCPAPQFPQPATTQIDSVCGVSGSGGSETNQNQAKNNFCPTSAATPITIADMVALQNKVQAIKGINFGNDKKHPLTQRPGPVVNRQPLVALGEGHEVVLQGYVHMARQEGSESVNCEKNVPDDPAYHDIHISVVDSATNADECSGVVVEMIPHHRPAAWTQANVQAAADKHVLVRVTGQLMFDSSHTPCIGGAVQEGDPKRASLWEVHPVYKFEVCPTGTCTDTGWTALESWVAKKAK